MRATLQFMEAVWECWRVRCIPHFPDIHILDEEDHGHLSTEDDMNPEDHDNPDLDRFFGGHEVKIRIMGF